MLGFAGEEQAGFKNWNGGVGLEGVVEVETGEELKSGCLLVSVSLLYGLKRI